MTRFKIDSKRLVRRDCVIYCERLVRHVCVTEGVDKQTNKQTNKQTDGKRFKALPSLLHTMMMYVLPV
jgi:hypothetical protein